MLSSQQMSVLQRSLMNGENLDVFDVWFRLLAEVF